MLYPHRQNTQDSMEISCRRMIRCKVGLDHYTSPRTEQIIYSLSVRCFNKSIVQEAIQVLESDEAQNSNSERSEQFQKTDRKLSNDMLPTVDEILLECLHIKYLSELG